MLYQYHVLLQDVKNMFEIVCACFIQSPYWNYLILLDCLEFQGYLHADVMNRFFFSYEF